MEGFQTLELASASCACLLLKAAAQEAGRDASQTLRKTVNPAPSFLEGLQRAAETQVRKTRRKNFPLDPLLPFGQHPATMNARETECCRTKAAALRERLLKGPIPPSMQSKDLFTHKPSSITISGEADLITNGWYIQLCSHT